ncbi:MAG TPA: FUSC family protein, partial [Sphingobacterium sp.]|nr:FUSC family protein [Sphingobacterium sp.]
QDIDANYGKLIDKHIEVNTHQEEVRDVLFQSKRSIKDTTSRGRFLTLVFADIVDLFEQSMTTHYDYATIHEKYGDSGLLRRVNNILHKISSELDNISYKLQINRTPLMRNDLNKDIEELRNALEQYDKKNNVNSIPIKKIIVNIRTIVRHIHQIYNYSQLKKVDIEREEIANTRKFIKEDIINLQSFRDNLSLSSNIFRHALRMSIVLSATYLVLHLINFSEFGIYWVLLTILVILKPGFGLTQERNLQRLIGTVIGGIIGALILILIPDQTIRFAILVIFFFIAYSLFRINYIMSVIFMTPYVLIMLSFTGANTLEIAKERIFDTFIGGVIAFLSSYIIFPNWESFQIKKNMRSLLVANYQYLAQAISILSGQRIGIIEYKLARKEVYIASANMGSTFQRLLTEPKWRQRITKEVNRFVILNHIFSSYSATLMTQLNESANQYFTNEDVRLFYKALQNLEKAIYALDDGSNDFTPIKSIKDIQDSNPDSDDAIIITEQLQFLVKISADLQKVTIELVRKNEEEEEREG